MTVFHKIFISFWLSVALSILATMLLTPPPQVPPPVILWRGITRDALSLYADQMATRYEAGGFGPAREVADQLLQRHNIRLSLFDLDGHFLSGVLTNAPPTSGFSSDLKLPERRGDSLMATLSATSASGKQYRVLAAIPDRLLRAGPPKGFDFQRFLILALTSGIVCYALAKYLTVRLVVLRKAAEKLGSGDLSARVPAASARSSDEIASVVRAFNRMAEQIESLVKVQRRLASDISHELRSPLARLNVALALARRKSGADAQHALDRIGLEAERLDNLVGEILRLSQLEGSATKTQRETLDFAELVREVADDAEFEARDKNAHVICTQIEPCSVVGDGELLRRAVENVLRNAVSYTENGTEVCVSLEVKQVPKGRSGVLTIRDYGPGVAESELNNIFRPFYRVGDDRDRKSGGTGLGLAISARAVQLHGGSVQARNADGKGLIIEITLPL